MTSAPATRHMCIGDGAGGPDRPHCRAAHLLAHRHAAKADERIRAAGHVARLRARHVLSARSLGLISASHLTPASMSVAPSPTMTTVR